MKTRLVATIEDADQLEAAVASSANKALSQLSVLGMASDGLRALWSLKVNPVGCDPLDPERPLNLIEQLNQTFTCIASARAVKVLLARHRDLAPFTLNLGTAGGGDIESRNGAGLSAEVFAAVNTSNNRKLANDLAKVGKCSGAAFKYVFFMCPGYASGRQSQLERNGEVIVWSVDSEI